MHSYSDMLSSSGNNNPLNELYHLLTWLRIEFEIRSRYKEDERLKELDENILT